MAAVVIAVRAELLKVKGQVESVQSSYKEHAEQRIEYQNKMAKLNQMVQSRSQDVMLIEDVIVVTLAAETAAQERYSILPEAPTKQAQSVQPGQTTKSAQEAIEIYKSQIEFLKAEMEYRQTLDKAESDMDVIYRQAVDDILDIMDEYCTDSRLKSEIERFATGGIAPSSPRKSPGKIKSILSAPSSPVKSLFLPKSPSNGNSPAATPKKQLPDDAATPKVAFSSLNNRTPSKINPPPLIDDDDSTEKDAREVEGRAEAVDNERPPEDERVEKDDELSESSPASEKKNDMKDDTLLEDDGESKQTKEKKSISSDSVIQEDEAPELKTETLEVQPSDNVEGSPAKKKKQKTKKVFELGEEDNRDMDGDANSSCDVELSEGIESAAVAETKTKKTKSTTRDEDEAPQKSKEDAATTKKKTKKAKSTAKNKDVATASEDAVPVKKKKTRKSKTKK